MHFLRILLPRHAKPFLMKTRNPLCLLTVRFHSRGNPIFQEALNLLPKVLEPLIISLGHIKHLLIRCIHLVIPIFLTDFTAVFFFIFMDNPLLKCPKPLRITHLTFSFHLTYRLFHCPNQRLHMFPLPKQLRKVFFKSIPDIKIFPI